jgi:hypothetical protein
MRSRYFSLSALPIPSLRRPAFLMLKKSAGIPAQSAYGLLTTVC